MPKTMTVLLLIAGCAMDTATYQEDEKNALGDYDEIRLVRETATEEVSLAAGDRMERPVRVNIESSHREGQRAGLIAVATEIPARLGESIRIHVSNDYLSSYALLVRGHRAGTVLDSNEETSWFNLLDTDGCRVNNDEGCAFTEIEIQGDGSFRAKVADLSGNDSPSEITGSHPELAAADAVGVTAVPYNAIGLLHVDWNPLLPGAFYDTTIHFESPEGSASAAE